MQEFIDEIDTAIKALVKKGRIPGLIVCVRAGDAGADPLYFEAHGNPGLNLETALNKNNLFLIASQSKTFTAASVLWLCGRGHLNLNDRLLYLLPDLELHPDHARLADIKVKHLLEHRAPLQWRGEMYGRWEMGSPYPSVAEISGPKLFPMLNPRILEEGNGKPGYSNPSYALLGAIVGQVASANNLGSSYTDFVRKNLLYPHGLNEIHPGLTREEIDNAQNIVQGYYLVRGDTIKPSIKPALDACVPAGGFYATAGQLSKFYHLLLTPGTILSETDLEMMKNFKREFPNGMGLDGFEEGWFGHDGTLTGYKSRTANKGGITISMMMPLGTLATAGKSDRLCQTPREDPPFAEISAIVNKALATHYPDQKWTPEIPKPGSEISGNLGPVPT